MKRIIATVLCFAVVFGLAACSKPQGDGSSVIYEYEYVNGSNSGNSSDGDNVSESGNSGQSSGSSKTESGKGETGKNVTVTNNCYSSGTKIAKDKITLKVLVRDYSGGITDYNNCALTKYIEKELNIKLQFTTCSQSEVSTKMTLAYSSGKNPYDIYMGMAPAGNLHNSYIKQGKVTKLDSLINTYGTNIKKLFSEYPEAQYLCTAEDGGIYMLPMVDDRENYCDLIYINKKWLSAVGKTLPTTTDEFKAVLEAFKAKYPGKTPFAANSDAGEDVGPSAFGPFGISTYHNWMYIDQSKDEIKYACTSDAYRNGLRYYNSLFSAGLLKLVVNKGALLKLTDSDSVGAILTDSTAKSFSAEKFNSDWTMVPVLNAKSGGTWSNVKFENTWAEWFVVTNACKYPECAVRLADWFYSEEGTISTQYGPKGTYWNYSGDNSIKFNTSKIPSGKTATEYISTLTPSYCLPRYLGTDYYALNKTASSTTAEQKMSKTIDELKKTLIKPNAQQKHYFPHLSFTADENKQTSDVGDYGYYSYQMRKQFITGTKSIDSDWDAYVSTINGTYKMNTVVKVQNSAYKRYKAWLATKK